MACTYLPRVKVVMVFSIVSTVPRVPTCSSGATDITTQ
jgi:hypothetical protein